jgi:hypothetical protein
LRGKKAPLAKDGVVYAKFYDELAGRPFPRAMSLEQSISCTLNYEGGGFFATSTSVPTFASQSFVLSSFGGYLSYVGLFDQYRFDQIEVWIEPECPMATTTFGLIATTVDLDDANTPSTFAAVADHPGSLIGLGGAGRYHKWKPHMAVAVYSGAFTSFANEVAGWIDSASPNVQHYGLKMAGVATAASIPYAITVRAVITFRSPGIN